MLVDDAYLAHASHICVTTDCVSPFPSYRLSHVVPCIKQAFSEHVTLYLYQSHALFDSVKFRISADCYFLIVPARHRH